MWRSVSSTLALVGPAVASPLAAAAEPGSFSETDGVTIVPRTLRFWMTILMDGSVTSLRSRIVSFVLVLVGQSDARRVHAEDYVDPVARDDDRAHAVDLVDFDRDRDVPGAIEPAIDLPSGMVPAVRKSRWRVSGCPAVILPPAFAPITSAAEV